MNATKARMIGWSLVLAARLGLAQAALPTSYTGPWQTGIPPAGWTFASLGLDQIPDYDGLNDGAARFQTTNSAITIQYDAPAGALTYWVKGLTFSGGVFRVEQSADGTNWTELAAYTELPTSAVFQTGFPAAAARWLRFVYPNRVTGNVGVDGITVAAFVPPEISAVTATGGVVRVTVPATTSGRSYALEHTTAITNVPVFWTADDAQTGAGGALVLRDLAPTNVLRLYRVRDATP